MTGPRGEMDRVPVKGKLYGFMVTGPDERDVIGLVVVEVALVEGVVKGEFRSM